jgi:hypothetical protein
MNMRTEDRLSALKPILSLYHLLLFLLLGWGIASAGQAAGPRILSLGQDHFLPKATIEERLEAKSFSELGRSRLEDFDLIVLANIAYSDLPSVLRQGLGEYVRKGGSLLITGGSRSYGSGGYGRAELAGLLPFSILHDRDWIPTKTGVVEILASGHPAFAGLDPMRLPYTNIFNDLGLAPGSLALAQFSKYYRPPLMAERRVGEGLVFGIALDMNEMSQWAEKDRFCLNLVRYLLRSSGPARSR